MADGQALGSRLAAGDRSAAAEALNALERQDTPETAEALLDATGPRSLGSEAPGHLVGVTGPPGAGKSSLLGRLLEHWRSAQRSVGVLAVDPSSRRSGGSLLGDRARIAVDPADPDAIVRSMAAGDELGGLARPTRAAAQALTAAFDVVVVETVGVGQSETDVSELADTTVLVVQPASGDILQFLKAGVMEVPDILVVTKADLGAPALRSVGDLQAAVGALGITHVPVLSVSTVHPVTGVAELAAAIDEHHSQVDVAERRARARRSMALSDFAREHGERGLRAVGGRRRAARWLGERDPASSAAELRRALEGRAGQDR
ncbi:MAG: GTP-binding protein [Solirubrobacterales bacterium]